MYNPSLAQRLPDVQLPLIHVVDMDDMILSNSEDAEWYRILKNLPWLPYREIGATYYNALYDFNKNRELESSDVRESAKEASQRLLFGRATVDKNQPVLAEPQYNTAPVNPEQPAVVKFVQPAALGQPAPIKPVQPHEISPGVIPSRQGGPKPKDFFALLKSFIGAPLLGFKAEPEEVHNLLTSNPAYARVCGFSPSIGAAAYYSADVPSLRKLQQFDQIMTNYGLWDKAKLDEVRRNIVTGVIKPENTLVGDTTHYYANSVFETVGYVDEKGEQQKKSQSKPTKPCRCENPAECQHPWILADDGAGTIVKGPKKILWGHKASILGLPLQGIPLDAVAVADAATHDGQTIKPHVSRLFDQLPEVQPWIDYVLYDRAADDQGLKAEFWDELEIELKSSINPRRRKTITDNLPKGMKSLSPYGTLTCEAGFEMEYLGARYEAGYFIYQAPLVEGGQTSVCPNCPHKPQCSPNSTSGRVASIQFDMLPHINAEDAPMAKTFQAMMTRRPAVERMIKRLKCDLGDETLSKRSNRCFQAYLDKTLLAFHILLRQ